jgi:agmatinase
MDPVQISKQQKIAAFDPNSFGNTKGNIFGLPFSIEESTVVVIPVPWDVTVSSSAGTCDGPMNVFNESFQIDLYDEVIAEPWKAGIAMDEFPDEMYRLNSTLRAKAVKYIDYLEKNGSAKGVAKFEKTIGKINKATDNLCENLKNRSLTYLKQNKLVVVLGGDHSTPLGLIKALAETHDEFGLLQLDAHADLRPCFEGFTQSHASIMYNALSITQLSKLVQVGIRDICDQEIQLIQQTPDKIQTFFSRDIQRRLYEGETWKSITDQIVNQLPSKVYISFDIDCLDPAFCPTTGTPVPGGLSYNQVLYLIEKLVEARKTIIGFDLVETGPDKLDAIVSCRLLYKIIAMMLKSNNYEL